MEGGGNTDCRLCGATPNAPSPIDLEELQAIEVGMSRTRVVILSGQSLFSQGIASRLEQCLGSAELEIMPPRPSDVISRIAAARPSVVIWDASDATVSQSCSLKQLLLAFSAIKVISLDPQQGHIHVITSEQRTVCNISDLATEIEQSV
jgi:hypothetical protein